VNFLKRLFRTKLESTKDQIRDWNDPDGRKESMPCETITLEGVDTPLHDKLMMQAVAGGVAFHGNRATLHGVTLEWLWDEESGNLHITPLEHPWYFSCSEIESKIQQIVANAKKGDL
jgi:hypothetical protein